MPDDEASESGEVSESGAVTDAGVPTFEAVREKIESRYGTALGAAELDAETPEGRELAERYEQRQRAAADRLADIRASMRDDNGDA